MTRFAVPAEFAHDPSIPEIDTDRIGHCLICDGGESSVIARNLDYELKTCRNVWEFRLCTACQHLQLDPRPAIHELSRIYPTDYYSYDMQASVNRFALAGKRMLDRWKFNTILRCLQRPATSYLDIGCGDGKYLDLMAERGVANACLFGIELNDAAATRARARGYRVFGQRVEDVTDLPSGQIDLATMFHVLEHVADPVAVVRRIRTWLAPHGLLAIETPNFNSLDARLFADEYWGGYHTPRHWHIFAEASLRRLLESNGFRIEAVRFQTGHSFWLYSFHHLLRYNRRWPSRRIARLFDPLRSLPLLILVTAFDFARARLGANTSAITVIARAVG